MVGKIPGIMQVFIANALIIVFVENSFGWSLNPLSWFWHSQGCKLNLRSDLNRGHEPVFLTKKWHGLGYELAMPELVDEEGVFKLSKGEHLYIACPGNNNEIKGFTTNKGQATMSKCIKDKTLHLMGKDMESSDLECKNTVFSMLKETDKECGNYIGGEIQLGFEVDGWHPLVTLCFFRHRAETLHATHILYGSTLRGAEIKSKKNYFMKGPRHIYPGVNPASAYKQANQRDVFTRILGDNQANYILARSYLSRSHLAPDGDFLLGAWQHLTYFYVNTAPQWQSINSGNWLRLESLIRSFAISVKQDFLVTTGTYGVLELEGSDGLHKQLFLEPFQELMPVPLLFWKIVADPNRSTCIVFLVHNNPFLDKEPPTICNNICSNYGWPTNMDSIFKGFTYCCEYADFKSVVDYAPDLSCNNVLENLT